MQDCVFIIYEEVSLQKKIAFKQSNIFLKVDFEIAQKPKKFKGFL